MIMNVKLNLSDASILEYLEYGTVTCLLHLFTLGNFSRRINFALITNKIIFY
jgi:hypothetical protein